MSRSTHETSTSTPQSKGFSMSHLLYKIGSFSGRHPWRVISAWLVIAGAALMPAHPAEQRSTEASTRPITGTT
jgi:hypothetical protein